jgi:hypothetical protein
VQTKQTLWRCEFPRTAFFNETGDLSIETRAHIRKAESVQSQRFIYFQIANLEKSLINLESYVSIGSRHWHTARELQVCGNINNKTPPLGSIWDQVQVRVPHPAEPSLQTGADSLGVKLVIDQ